MIRNWQFGLLWCAGMVFTRSVAQPGPVPENPWLLQDYRPVLAVQFCDNPRLVSRSAFDGTMEECRAEFERLFDKCINDVPGVRLPVEFRNKKEQAAAVTLLYECMSSHYMGGATLEEFNRRHPAEPLSETGSAE